MEHEKEYQANYERLSAYATAHGYTLNPDKARVEKVIGLMTNNFLEYGKYYCPCKQSHPLNSDKDTLCPCNELKQEIEKDGHCFCRLFYRYAP